MLRLIVFNLLLLAITPLIGQNQSAENAGVKWYTIQEAEKLLKQSPRPLFIDTYTDWCGWCKKMDRETFSNNVISDILNTKYYPVKFDAEGKDEISFMGQKFINDGKYGKAHQLAVSLLQGQLSYPTVVFMVQEKEQFSVSPVPGFRDAREMEALLTYFADKVYTTKKWEEFQQSFQGLVK